MKIINRVPKETVVTFLVDDEEMVVGAKQLTGREAHLVETMSKPDRETHYQDDDVKIKVVIPTDLEAEGMIAWKSLTQCSIEYTDGGPLFKKDMEWGEFRDAWYTQGLVIDDVDLRDLILSVVAQVNPNLFPKSVRSSLEDVQGRFQK